MQSRRPVFRRCLAAFLAVVACVSFVGSPLMTHTARAQAVTVVGNIPDDLTRILDQILTQLVRAGTVALFNAAQTFLGQLAYDAATYIASGGKGQNALTQAKSPGDYFKQVGEDALGSAIGSLSDEFFESSIGFDLCKPPNPQNLLNIQLSLGNFLPQGGQGAFTRPRPSCDFQQIVTNYDQFFTTLTSQDLLQNINASFNTNASDVGASLQIFGRTAAKVSYDYTKAVQNRAEEGPFKSVTDVVSGNVKTPAALVAAQTQEQLVEGPNRDEGQRRNAILSSAADQGIVQLAVYTASMFINTLGSKLLGRILEKGLINAFDFSDLDQQTSIATTDPDAIPSRSREDARRANLSLRDVSLIRTSNVEILSELIACPDVRGTWNCAMDQQLAQAIRGNACDSGTCTIGKAIRQGLMKRDWRLYPDSMVRQNQDRNCYQQAYCAGNVRKLRLMRILPVGFEFAANSDANIARCASAEGCITLGEVVDNFSDCNEDGERDVDHPWCKLIDPGWVLTSFEQQCRLTGFGDQLVSTRFSQRAEECRDIQTCLKRNDKGECVGGYGYCVAEKTVYRFKGDECSQQAASCRNFTTRAGAQVSYLRNTLDYGQCSADNVGCLAYATLRRPDQSWMFAPTTTMYFDRTLEPCSANDEGCTRLLAAEVGGSSLNLLANASFERAVGDPLQLEGWSRVPAGAYVPTPLPPGEFAANATQALALSTGTEYFQRVTASPGRVMTLSVYARSTGSGSPNFRAAVAQFRNDTFSVAARISGAYAGATALFKSPSCEAAVSDPAAGSDTYGIDWRRFDCSFVTTDETRFIEIRLTGANSFVDAIQLEDGQFATRFIEGANTALPVVYMKIAPDEFQCTGAATDPEVCNKFAKACRQVDAGCQGYRDGTAAPEVPAILSANDLCPAECVGYAEYRKQASAFDLVIDDDTRFSDPADDGKAYFIPSTATQCTQQDVGCEVFTNLEAAAAGGEATSAFSYVRLCEKPDPTFTQTYFTWEGSESTGYQLRTWSLISQSGAGSGPRVVIRRGPDGEFKDPLTCTEELWRTGLDPDCRQFYDRDGRVFYVFFSQTVASSDACIPFRLSGRVSADDCRNTGGTFNAATGECSYNALPAESRSCNIQFAGCRAYAGAGSGNVFLSVNENFRGGLGVFTGGTPSPESLLVGDQSLRLDGAGSRTNVSFATAPGDLHRVSFWAKGAGPGMTLQLELRNAADPASSPVGVGTATLSGDWQRYSFGLFGGYAGASTSTLSWTLAGSGAPIAFIDEVRVERVRDTVYAVRDSWTTPAVCDQTFSGIPEPQAMLGCRQYTDRFQNLVNASRFTRLCRQEAIGCRAFVDTRNSEASGAETFVSSDESPVARRTFAVGETPTAADFFPSSTTTRPADRMLYLIYDRSKLCQSENMSCRAFGKPRYNQDKTEVTAFDTFYFKDDITKYGQALCRPSEQFCEEYSYLGTKDYFKDPVDQVCEYKEGVRLSAFDFLTPDGASYDPPEFEFLADGLYSGWFRKGLNTPCYPANLQGGNFFGLPLRGDEPYRGWVGLCNPADGECTEFRDPNDTTDPQFRTGKPYFFVDNSKLDKTTCGGNVDQSAGCILLRNQSNPILQYSAKATDLAYRANNFQPVQPIDCLADPSNPFCSGRCTGTRTTRRVGSTTVEPFEGIACTLDADCIDSPDYATTTTPLGTVSYGLRCVRPENDSNTLIKVNTDRDCAQWLGCESAETVFDPATNQYKDVCTNLALCDKSTDTPGEIFCANYVDRADAGAEPIFTEGRFFDIGSYSSRKVGLGRKDYSGFSIPDSFQIPDTVTARVGVDGAVTVANNETRYARDYRLTAIARIPVNLAGTPSGTPSRYPLAPTPGPNEAAALDETPLGRANPNLRLCQHVTSGIIGYYRQADRDAATRATTAKPFFNCYLPLRRDSDAYQFQNIVGTFGLEDPTTDTVLAKAFPAPECRANPEADSPFPASFVTGWDFSKNPPAPTGKITGYASANTCEFGEDCLCTYKRAEYEIPTLTKFYETLSTGVPPGVCFGGPRNGQSCLPSTVLQIAGSATAQAGIASANEQQLCGPPEQGGRCIASTKIEIIRGVFGTCLERDSTRILGDDRSANPCLTWNPNPILFGEKDPFHYQPTSGYLPPQTAGQYYCVSPNREPVTFNLTQQHIRRYRGDTPVKAPPSLEEVTRRRADNPAITDDPNIGDLDLDYRGAWDRHFDLSDGSKPAYAGQMTKMEYDEDWIAPDNRCSPSNCDFRSASLVGARIYGTTYPTADQCEAADPGEYASAGNTDASAIRLVDAGAGYTETFYRVNTNWMLFSMGASLTADPEATLGDNNLSYFRIIPTQFGQEGRLACGYQAAWVDNMPSVSYGDAGSRQQGEAAWRREFNREYSPFVTRANEEILSREDAGRDEPIRMRCVPDDSFLERGVSRPEEGDCYFKFWSTGYRDEGRGAFNGLFDETGDLVPGRHLMTIRRSPHRSNAACEGGKPYFSIRAVFQSPVDRTTAADPGVDDVQGPWKFVGFWVSACGGDTAGDQRYIYMNVQVGAAAACTDLAEVRSTASFQDAAFTDRVWSQSGYRDPATGVVYSDVNSPFSSALNTAPAGKEPLFQTGGSITGFSPLDPPTFLSSGIQTYYRNRTPPRDKWAFLTNLFARVYRVYKFHYLPVGTGDNACLFGPFKGTRCTPGDNPHVPGTQTGYSAACSLNGLNNGYCDPNLFSARDESITNVCTRGVARGIACTDDEICRAATFQRADGTPVPLFESCLLDVGAGWTTGTSPGTWDLGVETNINTQDAASRGAFKCRNGSDGRGGFKPMFSKGNPGYPTEFNCSVPQANSPDCPIKVGIDDDFDIIGTIHASCVGGYSAEGYTGRNYCKWSIEDRGGDLAQPEDMQAILGEYGLTLNPETTIGGRSLPQRVDGLAYVCQDVTDCIFRKAEFDDTTNPAECGVAAASRFESDPSSRAARIGRCVGGLKDGQVCNTGATSGELSCASVSTSDDRSYAESCGRVSDASGNPVSQCAFPSGVVTSPDPSDPDNDNNICTHSGGYIPRLDTCPNPNDEYCGLIAYKINDTQTYAAGTPPRGSLDPASPYPLPTDVTLGHYTPTFLGFSSPSVSVNDFAYITYYTPRPPRLAAPDTRDCPVPGQCPISRLDTMAFNGQSLGSVVAGGGQFKSSLRFYAWAAHNQMPLRQIVIDWGDGQTQVIDDTRMKNRKPFCGVQKECELAPGLTCQTNDDCPPATGRCVQVGVCASAPQRSCTSDADCTIGGVEDRCQIRTMFGNATDACQQDYFDFSHVYTCGALESRSLPSCAAVAGGTSAAVDPGRCYFGRTWDGFLLSGLSERPSCTARAECETAFRAAAGASTEIPPDLSCGPSGPTVTTRCSRDPAKACSTSAECAPGDECVESLAPPGGCFDSASNACRFTPRVMLQDNWGWCTGECRNEIVGGNLEDSSTVTVKHPYGGCYVGNVFNGTQSSRTRFNTRAGSAEPNPPSVPASQHYVTGNDEDTGLGECRLENSGTRRPWIVYPGSLQLRRSDEIAR